MPNRILTSVNLSDYDLRLSFPPGLPGEEAIAAAEFVLKTVVELGHKRARLGPWIDAKSGHEEVIVQSLSPEVGTPRKTLKLIRKALFRWSGR